MKTNTIHIVSLIVIALLGGCAVSDHAKFRAADQRAQEDERFRARQAICRDRVVVETEDGFSCASRMSERGRSDFGARNHRPKRRH